MGPVTVDGAPVAPVFPVYPKGPVGPVDPNPAYGRISTTAPVGPVPAQYCTPFPILKLNEPLAACGNSIPISPGASIGFAKFQSFAVPLLN
jgi:hypothetical protein